MTAHKSPTGFREDLVALMRKHRFRGIPTRAATAIKAAASGNDIEALNEWLPRATAQMLKDQR